jgi:UDP-glucose 4-epimerase
VPSGRGGRQYDTNLGGTVNLLRGLAEATRRLGEPVRLVFASSVKVYGPSDGQPINEQHQTAPMSPYGASKLACERLLAYQAATGALGAISLRCSPPPAQSAATATAILAA